MKRTRSKKSNSNVESQVKKRSKKRNSNLESQSSQEEGSVESYASDTFSTHSGENNEFINDKLRTIMYIKGDVKDPRTDSVELMQNILRKEMNILLEQAEEVASIQNSQVISCEHILFLMRKNKMKLKRLLGHLENMDKHKIHMTASSNTNDRSIPSKSGKRLEECFKFLQELGGFREFISNFHDKSDMDPALRMRLERRILLEKYMTPEEYVEYTKESFLATFCPRQQIWTFKNWLLQNHVTYFTVTPLAVIMIEFLALETVAVIIDAAIQIQSKRLGIGNIFSHVAKPDFIFAVPKAIEKPVDERKQVSDLPSTSGNKNVCSQSIFLTSPNSNLVSEVKSKKVNKNAKLHSNSKKDDESPHDKLNRHFLASIADDSFKPLDDDLASQFNEIMKGTKPFYTEEELNKLSGKEGYIKGSHNLFPSSTRPEGISSKILATSKPSFISEAKNKSGCEPSTDKNIRENVGSLKKDAVICSMSDSDVESPCPQENVNSSHNSSSSSISSEKTSSKISATAKSSIVSEVKSISGHAPSTDKNANTNTGSLKRDSVVCHMSDSDVKSPRTKENVSHFLKSFSSSISRGRASSKIPAMTKSSSVSELRNKSGQVPATDKNVKKYTGSLKEDIVIYPMSEDDVIPSYLPPEGTSKSLSGTSDEDTGKISKDVTEFFSEYALEQRVIFKRVALTPEEIAEAYFDLQKTNVEPIYSWFQIDQCFDTIPKLVCLVESPSVAVVKQYKGLL